MQDSILAPPMLDINGLDTLTICVGSREARLNVAEHAIGFQSH